MPAIHSQSITTSLVIQMFHNHKFIVLFFTCLFLSLFDNTYANAKGNELLHQITCTQSDNRIKVQVLKIANSEVETKLRFIKNNKVLYSFSSLGLKAFSIFELDNGNIASEWSSACGSGGKLVVFGYINGRIKTLIDTPIQYLRPEMIYPTGGKIINFTDSPNNEFLTQTIVVPLCKWSNSKQKNSEPVPASADIYIWNSKKKQYDVRQKIPWNKRFTQL